MEKAAFRRDAVRRRNMIAERAEKSGEIGRILRTCDWYREASWVFLYCSCHSEVETGEIAEAVLSDGKRAAVPRVGDHGMYFYEIRSMKEVSPGYRGIPEPLSCCPRYDAGRIKNDAAILLLVPGVAFSEDRYRMGYGKGFYDRYLSERFPHDGRIRHAVGLAFEEQVYPVIPRDSHDIRLDAIITEKGIRA